MRDQCITHIGLVPSLAAILVEHYRDELARRLRLTDLRSVKPEPGDLKSGDPDSLLSHRDPDACCALRKAGTDSINSKKRMKS